MKRYNIALKVDSTSARPTLKWRPSKKRNVSSQIFRTWDTPPLRRKRFTVRRVSDKTRRENLKPHHFCNLQQPHLSSPLASTSPLALPVDPHLSRWRDTLLTARGAGFHDREMHAGRQRTGKVRLLQVAEMVEV